MSFESRNQTSTDLLKPYLDQQLGLLDERRRPWTGVWNEISIHIDPDTGRFLKGVQGQNSREDNWGGPNRSGIVNNLTGHAMSTMASGIMSHLTNPDIRWFSLSFPELREDVSEEEKEWLSKMERGMRLMFSWSNLYDLLESVYLDLALYGTSALGAFDDPVDGLRFEHYPVGSYWLEQDLHGSVDTFFRVQLMNSRQLVDEYATAPDGTIVKELFSNLSEQAQEDFNRGDLYNVYEVVEYIGPMSRRKFLDGNSLTAELQNPSTGKMEEVPFVHVVYERSSSGRTRGFVKESDGYGDHRLLRHSGFRRFPILCPRWRRNEPDVYGRSPGREVLPDVRQLQFMTKTQNVALQKQADPPLVSYSGLGKKIDTRPGAINHVGLRAGQGSVGIQSIYQVDPRLDYYSAALQRLEDKLNTYTFYDLFLAVNQITQHNVSATQIIEMKNERLFRLLPLMIRMHRELLKPIVDMSFDRVYDLGIVDRPQGGIGQGQGLKRINADFTSILAQAIKSQSREATMDYVNHAYELGKMQMEFGRDPTAFDHIDVDKAMESYGKQLTVDPSVIRGGEQLEEYRAARAEIQKKRMDAQAQLQEMGGGNEDGS